MKQQLKSRMWSGGVVALVIGLAGASTFAHDNDAMGGHKDMMAAMDSNHDGRVSASEHAAYMQQMFEKADTNHDGMLSRAEMDAAMKSHGDHMKSDAMQNDHDADDMPAKK